MDSFKRLSIIIPAYNEAKTIHLILDRVYAVKLVHDLEKEVILVNDCSTDGTEEVLQAYKAAHPDMNMQYYRHEVNQGKGAAIHTGIKKATGEYLIIQDADLEYDPEEFNELLRPVIRGSADVVFGSRFLGGNPHRILFYWHSIGNKVLTRLSNMLTNLNLTDMETCCKLCNTQVIQNIESRGKRIRLRTGSNCKAGTDP